MGRRCTRRPTSARRAAAGGAADGAAGGAACTAARAEPSPRLLQQLAPPRRAQQPPRAAHGRGAAATPSSPRTSRRSRPTRRRLPRRRRRRPPRSPRTMARRGRGPQPQRDPCHGGSSAARSCGTAASSEAAMRRAALGGSAGCASTASQRARAPSCTARAPPAPRGALARVHGGGLGRRQRTASASAPRGARAGALDRGARRGAPGMYLHGRVRRASRVWATRAQPRRRCEVLAVRPGRRRPAPRATPRSRGPRYPPRHRPPPPPPPEHAAPGLLCAEHRRAIAERSGSTPASSASLGGRPTRRPPAPRWAWARAAAGAGALVRTLDAALHACGEGLEGPVPTWMGGLHVRLTPRRVIICTADKKRRCTAAAGGEGGCVPRALSLHGRRSCLLGREPLE